MNTRTKWCHSCDSVTAEYKVTYWTDKYIPKWSSPNGEQYCSYVCHDCYKEIGEQEDNGEIWGVSSEYIQQRKVRQ